MMYIVKVHNIGFELADHTVHDAILVREAHVEHFLVPLPGAVRCTIVAIYLDLVIATHPVFAWMAQLWQVITTSFLTLRFMC